jgi:uncharacterized protein (TIGR03083 family)
MAVDHLEVIESESARMVAALDANRAGRVPWSDRWSVATVAKHVGGTHHVVAQVVKGRPTTDFGVFATFTTPESSDPGLGAWVTEGTSALVSELRATDPDEPCWSWTELGTTVGFWRRRMAQETLVHRWDAQMGAGAAITPMAPAVAADGIDEYLDVFVAATRGLGGAPAGPSLGFACTDTDDRWRLDLPEPGTRTVTRGTAEGDLVLRGPAEGLLLTAWGRLRPEPAGVDVLGDAAILDRWAELLPPM